MGSCTSVTAPHTKADVLVCGLDSGGKSTMLEAYLDKRHRAPTNHGHVVLPTCGVSMVEDKLFRFFDMGGDGRYRDLWPRYYHRVAGVIWVVDSTDVDRAGVVRNEFRKMVEHPDMRSRSVPILVFLNKTDSRELSKLAVDQMQKLLMLDNLPHRSVRVVPSIALTGAGFDEGIDWLKSQLFAP